MNYRHEGVSNEKRMALLCAGLVGLGILLLPGRSMAQTYTMSNGGSTATVNVGNSGVLGMNSWSVAGLPQSQLNQQWFWYSVNGAAPQPINSISAASVFNFSQPASPLDDLGVQYNNQQLTVNVEYQLTGINANSADLMELLSIVNNSGSSINLSFYQYSNFNLLQNNNNTVSIGGSPGAYTGATQTTGGPGGNGIAEVIDAPLANYAEAAQVPQTLNELGTPAYLTLNDNTSASGNVSWAFQWNATVAANGGTFNITKDKGLSVSLVPEPSTLAFIALGAGALGLALRRKLA
jgi:PEP-CTERM motif-containing protein